MFLLIILFKYISFNFFNFLYNILCRCFAFGRRSHFAFIRHSGSRKPGGAPAQCCCVWYRHGHHERRLRRSVQYQGHPRRDGMPVSSAGADGRGFCVRPDGSAKGGAARLCRRTAPGGRVCSGTATDKERLPSDRE